MVSSLLNRTNFFAAVMVSAAFAVSGCGLSNASQASQTNVKNVDVFYNVPFRTAMKNVSFANIYDTANRQQGNPNPPGYLHDRICAGDVCISTETSPPKSMNFNTEFWWTVITNEQHKTPLKRTAFVHKNNKWCRQETAGLAVTPSLEDTLTEGVCVRGEALPASKGWVDAVYRTKTVVDVWRETSPVAVETSTPVSTPLYGSLTSGGTKIKLSTSFYSQGYAWKPFHVGTGKECVEVWAEKRKMSNCE